MNLTTGDWIGLAALAMGQAAAIVVALMRNAARMTSLEVKVDQVLNSQIVDHAKRLDRLEQDYFNRHK